MRPSADVLHFCRPPPGSGIRQTKTHGVSLSRFGLGTPVGLRHRRVPLAPSRDHGMLPRPIIAVQLDFTKQAGWLENLARLLPICGDHGRKFVESSEVPYFPN